MRAIEILAYIFSFCLATGVVVLINPYSSSMIRIEHQLPIDVTREGYNPLSGTGLFGDVIWGVAKFVSWVHSALTVFPSILGVLGIPSEIGWIIESAVMFSLGLYLFYLITGRRVED